MRTNISRYTTMFSDFPWPSNAPIFPNQRAVYHYLQNYVEHFGLANYIQLGSCVTQVKKKGKRWKVSWKNRGRTLHKEVDFVIVPSGIFSKPFIPDIKGIDEFKGTILHSKDYKSPSSCVNKRVVVVGVAPWKGKNCTLRILSVSSSSSIKHASPLLPQFSLGAYIPV